MENGQAPGGDGRGWKRYTGRMARSFNRPKDAFSHASSMLEYDDIPGDFNEVLARSTYLGNMKDDHLLRVYQLNYNYLVDFYDLSTRQKAINASQAINEDVKARTKGEMSEAMNRVFLVCWAKFSGEIGLTRTKGGAEREAQRSLNTPVGRMPQGFGYPSEAGLLVEDGQAGHKRPNPMGVNL